MIIMSAKDTYCRCAKSVSASNIVKLIISKVQLLLLICRCRLKLSDHSIV